MNTDAEFVGINLLATIITFAVMASLGYFVYGGISGALAIIVVLFVFGLTALLSFIPYVGVIIQGTVLYFVSWPWVSEFTQIEGTWLTTVIIVLSLFGGLVWTITSTAALSERKNSYDYSTQY